MALHQSTVQTFNLATSHRSQLPPGLRKNCSMHYPWFFENHKRLPNRRTRAYKKRAANNAQVPIVVRLVNQLECSKPSESTSLDGRKYRKGIKSRKCHCIDVNNDSMCSHEKVLRFFRRRDICYLSSSDDELFPAVSKMKKKKKRRR